MVSPESPRRQSNPGSAWYLLATVLGIVGSLVLLLVPQMSNAGGRTLEVLVVAGVFLLAAFIATGLGLIKKIRG